MAQVSYGTITITDTNDIESIIIEYARNQSTSSAPDSQTGGWSTTRPAWAQGYYIWQRARIHKSGTDASEDEFGTAVCITGSTGQTGTSITISSISYAVSTTESQPADSNFTYTTVPTVAENSWLWTKTEYSDGSKVYTKSKQGKSGNSITVTKTEYQSGTSPSTAPTGSWSTSIPSVAEGNYLWTKTTYSDGNYSYTVAKQGQSGTSVTISSTSVKYQVSTSATSAPIGTWQDDVQATTTGQYLWTRTIVTYSNGSSTTSYSVSAHGATGTSVSVSSIKYAKSTTDSQPSESSFGTTIPTVDEGEWLWTMTTYSNGSKMYTKSKQGKSGEDGRSLIATETKYTNVASGTTQSQVESLVESSWVNNVPSYDASKPDYWVRIKNTYDKTPTTEYIYYKDNAVGDALAAAAMANSLAQSANENANGAMGQAASNVNEVKRIWYAQAAATPIPAAPTTGITTSATHDAWSITKPAVNESYQYYFYCDQTKTGGGVYSWSEVILDTSTLSQYQIGAISAKVRNYWWDSAGAHIASGTSTSGEINASSPTSSYGYNTLTGLTGISFKYNDAKVVELNSTTPSLDFYQPPTISGNTVTQGKKTMMLSSNALRFYDPSDGTTEQAKLDTNGLVLSKGGIVAGTKGQTGYIYLSTVNHPVGTNGVTINGFTPTGSTEQWREVIGTKFGVTNAGTLYANNAVISGTITVGSGSTIDSGATIGGTSASTVVNNAATGAQASSDLSSFQTTVANTYATQSALSDVEGQIPSDINELSDTDGVIPSDLSDLTDTTNIISGAVSSGVAGKADKTEAVYRTQRIYYRKTTTGAPSKNLTWLATSGTGYGNWSTRIPQLTNGTTKYPYLYTAIQSQTVTQYNGGTGTNCSCSDVLLDDSTTVIDGGTIITGSIAANRLDVYDASINKISASAIDVDSITIGQSQVTNLTTDLSNKASSGAEYEVVIQVSSIDYTTPSATLKAIPTKLGESTTGSFVWYKNAINTAHGGTVSTTTNTNDTLTVSDLEALYIAVLQ